jgi:hypothetical protein
MAKLIRCKNVVEVRLAAGVMFQKVDIEDPLHLERGKVMRPKACRGYPHCRSTSVCLRWSEDGDKAPWSGLCVTTDLKLHTFDVPHNNSHLCPLGSLVEQGHLAQIVCRFGSSLTSTITVRSILEAGMSLRALRLLWSLLLLLLCLLVHGAVEMRVLACCRRVHGR